jgi:hypothetical protein
LFEKRHHLIVKGVNVDATVSPLVSLDIDDIVQGVPVHLLDAEERGSPELKLLNLLVKDDGLNFTRGEKDEREQVKDRNDEILPPKTTV